MDDVISCGLSPIKIQQHSQEPQSVTGFSPLHKLARVYWVEVSWGSEKSERFEQKGAYDVGQRGLRQGFSRRGTDPDVACAGRERSVARDEHTPELGRALSGEVAGEQTFYSDAVCADCLGDIKIRRCRHHGRGGFFLAHGNGEDSEGSEFDMVGVGKYFAARAGGHKPRRMVQNLSALLEGEVQRRNLATDFHLVDDRRR
ncbi:hypothetical protein E4U52_002410 [Claviceps spartinae]|nr:hypothetical protein E4U52_002410 [Claviceps spartinae]